MDIKQMYKDWGIILSPSFVYDKEMFMFATLIPLSYVEFVPDKAMYNDPIFVDVEVLEEWIPERYRLEGMKLLSERGFVLLTQDKTRYLIGHTNNHASNRYLFQTIVDGVSTEKRVEQHISDDDNFKELVETIDREFAAYERYCAANHKPDMAKKVGAALTTIVTDVYRTGKMSAQQLVQYFSLFNEIYNKLGSPDFIRNNDPKILGISKSLISSITPFQILKIAPYFIINAKKNKWGAALLGNLIYHKQDVLLKYKSTHNGNTAGTGGYV
jgi:hypothetical protein